MPRLCVVCTDPKRDEINRELIKVDSTINSVAQRFNLSRSSVDRHKRNHLRLSSRLESEAANALTIVRYATELYESAKRVLARAERLLEEDTETPARSVQAAAASLREVRGSIELLGRLVTGDDTKTTATESAWLDQALTEAVNQLQLPELVAGNHLPVDVEDAELVPAPE